MKVYKFKVRDYSTILIGKRVEKYCNSSVLQLCPITKEPNMPSICRDCSVKESGFIIQRGDGTTYFYEDYRVTMSELIYEDNE